MAFQLTFVKLRYTFLQPMPHNSQQILRQPSQLKEPIVDFERPKTEQKELGLNVQVIKYQNIE